MITKDELLSIGLTPNLNWVEDSLQHYDYTVERVSFIGTCDSTYLVVFHPRTQVVIVKQRQGYPFTNLVIKRLHNIEELSKELEQL